ncbi:MAG TPA: FAD binding domain-containing protein [Candidatus Dormibacteraeota bacterium]|nr:FAD binding domain-containing protein [Candidatus Dormibacteraeota bacterium]
MEFLQPATWAEALAMKAERPDSVPIAGGTDLMVELNFDRRRPPAVLDLTRIEELTDWTPDGDRLRVGARVTYARVIEELGDRLPALALASRTVGSPQIRNRGTLGGNLGTGSPAGDALPPLLAADAEVEVASHAAGVRRIPMRQFCLGPKRTALRPDELIAAVHVPAAAGPQQFAKVGTRNAMVIAVVSFALHLDLASGRARTGTGIGSAGPTPLRAEAAERFLDEALARGGLTQAATARFGELVAGAARPIDDVRGTAAYRRHALAVLARRTLAWAWAEARERAWS